MTNFYIGLAWILTFGIVGGYAVTLLVRGRRLAREVPADRQRWMSDSPPEDLLTAATSDDRSAASSPDASPAGERMTVSSTSGDADLGSAQ